MCGVSQGGFYAPVTSEIASDGFSIYISHPQFSPAVGSRYGSQMESADPSEPGVEEPEGSAVAEGDGAPHEGAVVQPDRGCSPVSDSDRDSPRYGCKSEVSTGKISFIRCIWNDGSICSSATYWRKAEFPQLQQKECTRNVKERPSPQRADENIYTQVSHPLAPYCSPNKKTIYWTLSILKSLSVSLLDRIAI